MNFSNKLKLCALKPAKTQSPKTLEVMAENRFKKRNTAEKNLNL
jgi:hypothetical protein